MVYRCNEPYNDLPPLPPTHELESVRVMHRCVTASRALAELKGAGNLIPNQSILINAIPLQEARLSSEIENIVTTQDELFRAVVEEPGRVDPRTKEVLRYRSALRHGYDALKDRPSPTISSRPFTHSMTAMAAPGASSISWFCFRVGCWTFPCCTSAATSSRTR